MFPLQETETEEDQAGQARVQRLRPGQRRRQLLPLQTVVTRQTGHSDQVGHSDQASGHTNTPIATHSSLQQNGNCLLVIIKPQQ